LYRGVDAKPHLVIIRNATLQSMLQAPKRVDVILRCDLHSEMFNMFSGVGLSSANNSGTSAVRWKQFDTSPWCLLNIVFSSNSAYNNEGKQQIADSPVVWSYKTFIRHAQTDEKTEEQRKRDLSSLAMFYV
jgi:hypothetical protein